MRYMSVARERPPVERIVRPFQDFADKQTSGGILLIAATVIALAWANSPWAESYADLWHTKLTVGVDDFSISKDLTHWINDGLMAVFFLVIGLEIKREVLVGELSSTRHAVLPGRRLGWGVGARADLPRHQRRDRGLGGLGDTYGHRHSLRPRCLGSARPEGTHDAQGVLDGAGHRGRHSGGAGDRAFLHLRDLLGALGVGPRSSRRSSWPTCSA
jgi:hypothetical protein